MSATTAALPRAPVRAAPPSDFPCAWLRRWQLTARALLLSCAALGCAGPPRPATAAVRSIEVESARDMNDHMALMLDFVFLYDDKLLDQLPKSAPEWFSERDALLLRYAGSLAILPLQMTVGDRTGELRLSRRHRAALAVVGYANYLSARGQARIDLSACRWARAVLLGDGWVVMEDARGGGERGKVEHDAPCGS